MKNIIKQIVYTKNKINELKIDCIHLKINKSQRKSTYRSKNSSTKSSKLAEIAHSSFSCYKQKLDIFNEINYLSGALHGMKLKLNV